MAEEGYHLSVTAKGVAIKAKTGKGAFYGMQSFLQLLPAEVESPTQVKGVKWVAQCCDIEDAPRFGYRGFHLDPCRHFITVENVKKQLDIMAMFKINTLHFHLTEDQGLRDKSPVTGKEIFTYGGDYGRYPASDYNFNCNGILAPDRRLNPHAYEVQYQLQNAWVKDFDAKEGTFKVYNENFFKNIDQLSLRAIISAIGYPVEDLDAGIEKEHAWGQHSGDLVDRDFVQLHIQQRQYGLGCVDAWMSKPMEKYRMHYQDREFRFVIKAK